MGKYRNKWEVHGHSFFCICCSPIPLTRFWNLVTLSAEDPLLGHDASRPNGWGGISLVQQGPCSIPSASKECWVPTHRETKRDIWEVLASCRFVMMLISSAAKQRVSMCDLRCWQGWGSSARLPVTFWLWRRVAAWLWITGKGMYSFLAHLSLN